MEKDGFFSWQSDSHSTAAAAAAAAVGMNNNRNQNHNGSNSNNNCIDKSQSAGPSSSMIMATSCFHNLNWDQSSADQTSNFESALSSLVSSPTSSNPNYIPFSSASADSIVIRELIGRLGSICNSSSSSPSCIGMGLVNGGEEMYNPTSNNNNNNTSSCYATPLNSPPKPNPAMIHDHRPTPFAAEGGFPERAATFSRVSSSQSLTAMPTAAAAGIGIGGQMVNHDMMMIRPSAGEFAQLDSSHVNVRKRKSAPASSDSNKRSINAKRGIGGGGGKVSEKENLGADGDTAITSKAEQGTTNRGSGHGKDDDKDEENNDAKPPEPPRQDYIHVRARRGQATDSHSLAERVRREKISERMKFLQDLVPGCNKVTGKAVMLDEIINYVQSLQRQVEFLSMKLATVNPRLEFNMDSLLSRDIHQPSCPLEASCTSTGFSYETQLPRGHGHGAPLQSLVVDDGLGNNPLDATSLRRSLSMQLPPLDGLSQLGTFWEDDLQSIVQMGSIGQNPEVIFSSQRFQGALPTNHMKVEL